MKNEFKNKKILVTGGTGSIGSELVKKLLEFEPHGIRILSRDESKQNDLMLELGKNSEKVRFLIGDIRDYDRVNMAMEDVDIVFHTAAMKHVLFCENDPFEAVKTNVIGTQNIINAAMANNVSKVIGISTDKATDPVSVMGCTKLLAEKIMLASYNYQGKRRTKFCFVRFGNVLNTRGSVLPLFYKQIMRGGPVTVTDTKMERFFMSKDEAVCLVMKAAGMMKEREIFIFKMPILKIIDLAKAMIELFAPRFGFDPKKLKINVVGKKRGERIHEKLLTKDESAFALETDDMFIIVPVIGWFQNRHSLNKIYPKAKRSRVMDYSTEGKSVLTVSQIKAILNKEDSRLLAMVKDCN
ncbi:MAG: Polysaccharide biosynthesis protein CapD [Candidatus Magasanikbacteria bacterium GW2011_GWC2_41_17]|uniref:Polysaccharide biosynthesis protein CapD n=2 Tax=Candidatus Magasanikiibacteriota TaxID=1752731 RepID=A0A0G0WLG9_9BACT|nr:MAG: Polysaccharide biosynthesis protein CapD [Candidatus Magasanikbacteria bacterium GW2011_GWC2_41_17]KKS13640.1 MAG: Polysaccharide biosynthesis protein CapD [Candidatus Magasanikbacteria bacterium GW2011_GWA2_41_55]